MSYAPATTKPAVPIVVVPVGVVRPAAPLYSNLGKGAKDLLSKGFPSTHKVEVTTSAENGFQFVSSAEKKQANKADVVVGTFQPKYKIISRGIELIGTFDTANQIKGELSMENLLVPGVKGTFKAQTGASSDIEAALEYKHEAGTFTSTIVHNPIAASTLLSATATVSRQAITAGLESKYAIGSNLPGTLTTVTGALNYKAATHDLTAFVKSDAPSVTDGGAAPRLYSLGAHLHYTPSKESSFASSLDYDLQKNTIKVTIGGSQKLDARTETKAKYSSDGRLGLGVAQQLTPAVKATLGTELNTFDLAGTTPKFGVHFEVRA
jgi:voltage-dependent anion channel protein 2